MPRLAYYYRHTDDETPKEKAFRQGFALIEEHKLFRYLGGEVHIKPNKEYGRNGIAAIEKNRRIYVNTNLSRTPQEWAYTIAHCLLHLAFGHYDDDRIPKDDNGHYDPILWNIACDIYITRFLYDITFGEPACDDPAEVYSIKLNEE